MRRPRFSLRTFLTLFMVVALLLAALGAELFRARKQASVVSRLHQAGVNCVYYDIPSGGGFRQTSDSPSKGWRRHVGETFLSEVNGINIDGASDDQLQAMEPYLLQLPDLWFVQLRTAPGLTGNGMRCLAGIPHLRKLVALGPVDASGDLFAHLARCTELEELSLSPATFSKADAQHLTSLVRLTTLELSEAKTSENSLGPLADLPLLTHLDLRGTNVTDAGVAHLRNLPQLAFLGLGGTRVTDNAVPLLGKLASLEALDIKRTQITEEGAKELRRLLPNTRVKWKIPTKFDINGVPLDGG